MRPVRRALQRFAARLQAPGVAGVTLALVASLGWLALAPALEERAALQERLTNLRTRAAAGPAAHLALPSSPKQSLARFREHFPDERGAAQDLLRLHDIAARHGLRLPSGDYRFAVEAGTGVARYQIVLPVKAAYPAVRRFLADALAEMPTLAVDALALKRDDVSVREVEGRIQLSLFVASGT